MTAPLKKLRAVLTPEQEILRNRLIMGVPAGISCYFLAFDSLIIAAFVTFLACNAALYVMEKFGIWRAEERWFSGIILDVLMAFAVMLREPEQMSIFYPILLWMILGNGFRFGLKWLFVAAVLATLAFGTVVMTTAYWQPHRIMGLSLTAALFIIPAYCSTLIRKISHAKEQAEIASRAKSYFLASVSHELRTPLNAIIGYGTHLRQIDMPRSQKEMIEASVLAGEHLLHLIEQLIEVAKSGTGTAQIKKSKFRPTELLTEIRAIMAVRAEEKNLALQLQAEPLSDSMVEGPSDVLRNILLNLTGNAIKFTEAGSIAIASGISEHGGKHSIWFTVNDTGIGIAEGAMDLIFQPFQQADDTVMNRFGGTGLGLAICKQLVDQVNGTITASSSIGKGSSFRIEVPVEIVAAKDAAIEPVSSGAVHILSFGDVAPDLLAGAQSLENIVVRHVNCQTPGDLEMALANLDLAQFEVALIAESLATQVEPENAIWAMFAAAEVAPVLVKGRGAVEVDDINLRAAFASILPPSPNFDELRSAIRIGCSFANHFRLPHSDDVPAVNISSPRKVLVADDNRTNRNVLAAILESAGHIVTMVTDGDEALEALEQSKFDILLLDVNMPRLNGVDACAMWRQIEGGRQHLPIIGVTADATAETELKCKNAGMDLRLTKPVDAKLLLATIEHFCGEEQSFVPSETERSPDPFSVVVPFGRVPSIAGDAIDQTQLDYLMSIGDTRFVAGMIEGFFEDVQQIREPLRRSVENGDVQEFRFCAHAFKSSGNNMGAKHLAALCGKLEKVTEPDFAEHRHAYLEKIEQELERATDALKSLSLSGYPGVAANRR
jgi:two-component system, sensor histidine kinase RpfC